MIVACYEMPAETTRKLEHFGNLKRIQLPNIRSLPQYGNFPAVKAWRFSGKPRITRKLYKWNACQVDSNPKV